MRVAHVSSVSVVEALETTLRAAGCVPVDVESLVGVASRAWDGPVPVSFADMGAAGTLATFHTAGHGKDYCIVLVLVLVLEVERVLGVVQDPACPRERREELVRGMHGVGAFLGGLRPSTAAKVQATAVEHLVTLATRVVDVMARRAERVGAPALAPGPEAAEQFAHFENTGCMALRAVAYLGTLSVPRGGVDVVVGGLGVCTWLTRLAEVGATHVMEVLLEFGPCMRGLHAPRYAMQVLHVGHLCLLLSQLWREAEAGQGEETGALFGFRYRWGDLFASKVPVEWQRGNGFGSRDALVLLDQGHTHKDWFRVGPRFLEAWWGLAGVGLGLAEEAAAYRPVNKSRDLPLGTVEECVAHMGLAVGYLTRILPMPEPEPTGAHPGVGAAMQTARRALLDLCSSQQGMTRALLPCKTFGGSHHAGASWCVSFEDVWEEPRTHGPALAVTASVQEILVTKKRVVLTDAYGRDDLRLWSGLEAKAMCMVGHLVQHGLGSDIVNSLSQLWGRDQTIVNPEAPVNCWGTSTKTGRPTFDGVWTAAVETADAMNRRWSANRRAWVAQVAVASIMRRRGIPFASARSKASVPVASPSNKRVRVVEVAA